MHIKRPVFGHGWFSHTTRHTFVQFPKYQRSLHRHTGPSNQNSVWVWHFCWWVDSGISGSHVWGQHYFRLAAHKIDIFHRNYMKTSKLMLRAIFWKRSISTFCGLCCEPRASDNMLWLVALNPTNNAMLFIRYFAKVIGPHKGSINITYMGTHGQKTKKNIILP